MIAAARPARFGRGEQTLMDLSVRDSSKSRVLFSQVKDL